MRTNRTIILGANYDTHNMGVDALLSGTIRALLDGDPNTEIMVVDYGREPKIYRIPGNSQEVEVPLVNIRFSWRLWLSNNTFTLLLVGTLLRLIRAPVVRSQCLKQFPVLATFYGARRALSLAGGDSFSDIYGARRLVYVALPQLLALATRTPLILLPQTIGPFQRSWARWLGSSIMGAAERVFARDRTSHKHAQELLGNKRGIAAFSPDMAFVLEPRAPEVLPTWLEDGTRPLVGLNVSGLLMMGGYTRENMFGLRVIFAELADQIIRWLVHTAKVHVVLVSHVTGAESDAAVCVRLHDQLAPECNGRLHLLDATYDHRETKYIIGRCDFFLGARMHACIAALSQGVPAIGLAYSRKFVGVFESVGVPDLAIDLLNSDLAGAMETISDRFARRDEYRATLNHTLPQVRQSVLRIFEQQSGTTV